MANIVAGAHAAASYITLRGKRVRAVNHAPIHRFVSLSANMYPKNKRTTCVALAREIKLTNNQCLLSVLKRKEKEKNNKLKAILIASFFVTL